MGPVLVDKDSEGYSSVSIQQRPRTGTHVHKILPAMVVLLTFRELLVHGGLYLGVTILWLHHRFDNRGPKLGLPGCPQLER